MPSHSVPTVQLGAGFIGQMHSIAMSRASHARREPAVEAELRALADRDTELVASVAERFGWERATADWSDVLESDARLFVNAGPNDLHLAPTVAAAQTGLDVFCEKPLATTAEEAHRLWRDVAATGVNHRCAFLHRFIPALQLARRLIAEGEIGTVLHFRSQFLLDMLAGESPTWRFDRSVAGPGAVGDLGSHHLDVARFLVGEVTEVHRRADGRRHGGLRGLARRRRPRPHRAHRG